MANNERNPNSEIRNPKESRSSKPGSVMAAGNFRNSEFGFLSDFGIRFSDFRIAAPLTLFHHILETLLPLRQLQPKASFQLLTAQHRVGRALRERWILGRRNPFDLRTFPFCAWHE